MPFACFACAVHCGDPVPRARSSSRSRSVCTGRKRKRVAAGCKGEGVCSKGVAASKGEGASKWGGASKGPRDVGACKVEHWFGRMRGSKAEHRRHALWWLLRGGRSAVDSALFPALGAAVVLLHPLLDCVGGEHVAAGSDAGVVGGDVVECDAALLFLFHGLGDDHWGNVRGQVGCSGSTGPPKN